MDKMKIEIWSDIACPYCYIGKRKLEMALEQFEHKDKVQLVWHSYELDPSLTNEPADIEYFARKFGTDIEGVKKHQREVTALAAEVGLNYDFDNLKSVNTSNALRLVKLAAESGLATEAEEVLFEAYFVKGLNISDRTVLLQLGQNIGLKKEAIEQMLDSMKYYDKIKEDIKYSDEKLNLEYIPFYRLNDSLIIQGSIAVEDYLKALRKAYADWQSGTASDDDIITGQSCSIDGVCS